MRLIFLGPTGSGKGTQAKIISSQFGLRHLSTGDMLRDVSKSETELGKKLEEIMTKGDLVTDELVNQIVSETLNKPEYKNYILDGFPRTRAQAEFLSEIIGEDYLVINFDLDSEILKTRVVSRFTCKKCHAIYNIELHPLKKEGVCDICGSTEFDHRSDNNDESITKRIDIYKEQIASILDFYSGKEKLYIVNASDTVENISKHIIDTIKTIDFE